MNRSTSPQPNTVADTDITARAREIAENLPQLRVDTEAAAVWERLTKAQRRLLQANDELPPGGYRGAGPDASRWYRTWAVLQRLRLVLHPLDRQGYMLPMRLVQTDLGRRVAAHGEHERTDGAR